MTPEGGEDNNFICYLWKIGKSKYGADARLCFDTIDLYNL